MEMYHEMHLRKYCVAAWLWTSRDRELSAETVHVFVNVTMDHEEHLVGRRNEASKTRVYEVDRYNFDRPAPV